MTSRVSWCFTQDTRCAHIPIVIGELRCWICLYFRMHGGKIELIVLEIRRQATYEAQPSLVLLFDYFIGFQGVEQHSNSLFRFSIRNVCKYYFHILSIISSIKKVRRTEICLYIAVLAICMYSFIWLRAIFPYGVAFRDSPSWVFQLHDFHFFSPFYGSHTRRPVFSLLAMLSMKANQPSFFVTQIHIYLFIGSMLMTCWFTRFLFAKRWLRFLCMMLYLIVQIGSLRLFVETMFLGSDSLYAHLSYMGSLLLLSTLFTKQKAALLVGSVLLCIASFTRPTGVLLLLAWGPVFLYLAYQDKCVRKCALACLVLFILPNVAWELRNKVVEPDTSVPTASDFFFHKSLYFLSANDRILQDSVLNAQFVNTVKGFQRSRKEAEWVKTHVAHVERQFIQSFYFLGEYSIDEDSPTTNEILRAQVSKISEKNEPQTMADLEKSIAFSIFKKRPLAHAQLTAAIFLALSDNFRGCGSRLRLTPERQSVIHEDLKTYNQGRRLLDSMYGALPVTAIVKTEHVDSHPMMQICSLIGARNMFLFRLFWIVVMHMIAICTLLVLIMNPMNRYADWGPIRLKRSLMISCVFLFAASIQNAASAVTNIAAHRLSFPTELYLNFIHVVYVILLCKLMWHVTKEVLASVVRFRKRAKA